MGFSEIRKTVIDALLDGRFRHQNRPDAIEKNLLYADVVSAQQVVDLLWRCRGDQHSTDLYHGDLEQVVHIFKPRDASGTWYIKCVIVELDGVEAVFISVHQ